MLRYEWRNIKDRESTRTVTDYVLYWAKDTIVKDSYLKTGTHARRLMLLSVLMLEACIQNNNRCQGVQGAFFSDKKSSTTSQYMHHKKVMAENMGKGHDGR